MSDFHPAHWNPSWSVATILNGLLSFMVGDENTTGSVHTSDADKRWLASRSKAYNRSHALFCQVFPELCEPSSTETEPATSPSSPSPPVQTVEERAPLRIRSDQHAQNTQTAPKPRHTLFGTGIESWAKIVCAFVVFAYLVAVKLAARSA
jgi:ubiquitin-conjugating enzyme E2 J2